MKTEKLDAEEAQRFIGLKENVLNIGDNSAPLMRNGELVGTGLTQAYFGNGIYENRYEKVNDLPSEWLELLKEN